MHRNVRNATRTSHASSNCFKIETNAGGAVNCALVQFRRIVLSWTLTHRRHRTARTETHVPQCTHCNTHIAKERTHRNVCGAENHAHVQPQRNIYTVTHKVTHALQGNKDTASHAPQSHALAKRFKIQTNVRQLVRVLNLDTQFYRECYRTALFAFLFSLSIRHVNLFHPNLNLRISIVRIMSGW